MKTRDFLLALSVKYDGDWLKIFNAISNKEVISEKEVDEYCSKVKSNFITILDPEYPDYLKRYRSPPIILYYCGDLNLLQSCERNLAVVGTRKPTQKYIEQTTKIITNLESDITIVSGVAKGIDAVAHTAALKSHKKTIGVIGCGLDVVYPLENKAIYKDIKQKGLLISEYPDGSTPDTSHFPQRNRIIAMLAHSIFVPQAYLQSGTSITVGFGLEMNKDIYCLPSDEFGNSGCNIMIKEGAYLVENEVDITEFFL